jgi:hypothetical protein
MKAKLIKTEVNYILEDNKGVVIASTSLKKEGLSLSLKNCQSIERGYDLDELLDNITPKNGTTGNISERIGFVKGFQKAMELMGDKKFSINEVVELCKILISNPFETSGKTYQELTDNYIQSLQQTEWDVEIEMICPHPKDTYVCGIQYGCDEDGCNHPNQVPYLDVDGCLILKKL